MKKVALVDVDNSEKVRFPNLVLMKASTYYKNKGYDVRLIHGKTLDQYDKEYNRDKRGKEHDEFDPDIIIKSKIFTWTKDKNLFHHDSEYYFGGTGSPDISLKIDPEIDEQRPDYDLYRKKDKETGKYEYLYRKDKLEYFRDAGIGFITRGCPRNCSFCFVPEKEGKIQPYMKIDDFRNPKSDKLILLDNNILAHEHGINEIKRMRDDGLRVDFNQGLDPHIISRKEEIAELLANLKWINQVRLACDEPKDKKALEGAVKLLRDYKIKGRLFAYTIITPDVDESYDRIKFVDSLGVIPYAQSLRDKEDTPPTIYMQALQKWVATASAGGFQSFSFDDYLNNILRYDAGKHIFREVKNRIKKTKEWKIAHKGEKRKKRNMSLIEGIINKKIETDIKKSIPVSIKNLK